MYVFMRKYSDLIFKYFIKRFLLLMITTCFLFLDWSNKVWSIQKGPILQNVEGRINIHLNFDWYFHL